MDKDKISSFAIALSLALGMLFVGFMAGQIGATIHDEGINKTTTICNDIGLDVLSVSRQVFGDDYVVCYNKETNETRRVEV